MAQLKKNQSETSDFFEVFDRILNREEAFPLSGKLDAFVSHLVLIICIKSLDCFPKAHRRHASQSPRNPREMPARPDVSSFQVRPRSSVRDDWCRSQSRQQTYQENPPGA
jgi:hypothetical protein